MLANGIVSKNLKRVMIGPGSVIDPVNLYNEIVAAGHLLDGVKIYVHANAAVIEQRHRDEEAGPMTKIGSTKKGCGAAAIHRIRRNPTDMNTAAILLQNYPVFKHVRVVGPKDYADVLDQASLIQVEGAQGYSLSMYHGFYPYCTSRDVSTAQVLADCALPHNFGDLRVLGTARTFPIRVANRYDNKGNQIGWSGPAYPDQHETTFEALRQKTELTTVTKLPRRIFTFSKEQVRQAIRQCGVSEVFLNFANYTRNNEELEALVNAINTSGAKVKWLGWGPTFHDVKEVG
jgi:adenylosuccinate synthase